MKTWQKVLIGAVVAAIAIVALIFWATGGIARTADDFFSAAKAGDMDSAYALTSQQLQEGTSQEELGRFLHASKLDQVIETSWSSRSIQADTGTLEGTATTGTGAKIPLRLEFVKEGGEWRIILLKKTVAGIEDSNSAVSLPPLPDEQRRMVLQDTRRLIEALIDNNPEHFLKGWPEEATVENLGEGFSTLRPFADRMVALAQQEPKISAAAMGKDGVLLLEGTYRVAGDLAIMRLEYMKFDGAWKIVSYNYKISADPDTDPGETEE
ncbi:hypothetical protein [Erythrobacter mangrovi]|uniref:Uncharacterized protein n=1 Tax=Erythrobacter mangrovi TaxID=2739433 RepID=A0A7D4CDE1_9SPHN|nr:hypothetical protein [Erythrobacter mangrovi]QKG71569.1 hypothetical protein HQR01_09455 [Erythrobacter mangrovi]